MKRYLLFGGWKASTPISKDELSKQDLIDLKNGEVDLIIDTETNTYYCADTNSWEEIKIIE